ARELVEQSVSAGDVDAAAAVVGNRVVDPGAADLPLISGCDLHGLQQNSITPVGLDVVVNDVHQHAGIGLRDQMNSVLCVAGDDVSSDLKVQQIRAAISRVEQNS